MENAESVLVIDDDPAFNRVLCRALKNRGFAAAGAHSVEEAAALIPDMQAARAVLDLNIDGTSGLTLVAPLLAAGRAFVTTREEGTGIGLFLAHAAVERLGGRIVLANRDGGGAVTRIELPLENIRAEEK